MALSAWTGAWVADRLGVRVSTTAGRDVHDLAGLALRRNPRRAHLLVSPVLGKHVPVDPRASIAAGDDLAALVAPLLGPGTRSLVIGYAETATGLGHVVARALAAPYLHSTRRPAGGPQLLGFTEAHSHAQEHRLLPRDPRVLEQVDAVVLVDDELSTGRTALATVRALHAVHPVRRYVVAALLDLRDDEARQAGDDLAAELGTSIDVVGLAQGRVELPDGLPAAAAEVLAALPAPRVPAAPRGVVRRVGAWPVDVAEGGRHGFAPAEEPAFAAACDALAEELAGTVSGRVHVLGTEELMYLPLRVAAALAERLDGAVTFSSTTRSPVAVVDDPGYAVRSVLRFGSHDDPEDGPGERYAYNLLDLGADVVVVVVDASADTPELVAPGGLVDRLAQVVPEVVVVVVPEIGRRPRALRGPGFGSYAPDEVAWLLTDLSHVELEAPLEEREEAIQAGRAHYAESLPVEYQPTPAYHALFEQALAETAPRLALAVGVAAEIMLETRGDRIALASLARAGTPVGILLRRWAREVHGLDLPHATISIVRGRGIDEVALAHLAARHRPEDVVLVDGWTGKGAITRELSASLTALNERDGTAWDDRLVVLADTGHCVETYGTRDDFLIASACLNSTVSGLVSRTVLNDRLIGPGDLHGAKFYDHLRDADRSAQFLDAVSVHFGSVREAVATEASRLLATDRTPTWSGWAAVEEVARRHGLDSLHLVKPGVGETTRVLLRRVPWKVLVRPGAQDGLAHVLDLAAQRGVEVEEVPDLAYSCIGLIRPQEAP